MNAVIFHGMRLSPSDCWYPWLQDELEKRGFTVAVPSYPAINQEPLETLLPKVLQDNHFDEHTVLIGHSAGCPLILSILERLEVVVAQAVLVAGFFEPASSDDPLLQPSYDWGRIKQHARNFVFINSVNDEYGCTDKEGRALFDHLGGTLVIRNDGHFMETADGQPWRTLPLALQLIDLEKEFGRTMQELEERITATTRLNA